jgi:biopolymer transport protein ExbB
MQRLRSWKVLAWGITACLVMITCLETPARAWWDGKWQHRKKVVLDTTGQGAELKESVADFPLLLRLNSGNFDFANAKSDGSDIRMVGADDKTPLKFHIERYDPKEDMALIWVKAPRLAASGQDFIWIYYGNNAAASGQDPGGTYDASQLAVYHFGEKEGPPKDATAYGNHGKEFTGTQDTPGAIGRGVRLKGEGDRLVVPRSPSLNLSKGFTFSAWVRPARDQKDARLFSWDDGKQSVVVGIDGMKLYCTLSGRARTSVTAPSDLAVSKWVHVAIAADPGKGLTIYTGGQERGSQKLSGALPEPEADLSIGASLDGRHAFAGELDEVEIAGVCRPPTWIRAAAVSQGPETPLLSYLEEESTSGGGAESLTIHLLVVTAKAITLDGWLIIGGIVVMIAITWILFFNKFFLLRKLKKDDAAFSQAFGAADRVRLVEGEEAFPDSSQYRVYGAGLAELERRLRKMEDAGAACLPGQAITAFKAALDKASLQESKRNTAGLLLFTLSISGGPFMGLFGTVWGVINTFAGVAEAGEANLAAIAPGVASALACTLMGLMLAIPALFQYSYLSAEIKGITADMNVFMDEFTNRVEEEYGGRT